MCSTCLRSGWRGILEEGKKVISMLDKLNIWPVYGDAKSTPGKAGLSTRLKRLFDFIRLQLHLHFEEQSGIASHCLRLHLGSLAEPRFNTPCTHKHPSPKLHKPGTAYATTKQCRQRIYENKTIRAKVGIFLGGDDRVKFSSTCTQHRRNWSQEWPESKWYGESGPPLHEERAGMCTTSGCEKKATCHCVHCESSYCRPHCAAVLETSEKMPPTFGQRHVCPKCSPRVESVNHDAKGCATCEEIHFFKHDLMKCVEQSKDE